MNADACSALAGVFSVLLLVVPLEGRALRLSIRSHKLYSVLPAASLVCSVMGIVASITGVVRGGIANEDVMWAWFPFYGGLAVTAAFLFFLVQQDSDEADAEVARLAALQAIADAQGTQTAAAATNTSTQSSAVAQTAQN